MDEETQRRFARAIFEVLEMYVKPFNDKLKDLPNYRISKSVAIKRCSQSNEKDLIPKLPKAFREVNGKEFDSKKVCASTLESKKFKQTILFVNQTLMCFHSAKIREKYSQFLKESGVVILSDIFERMDLNRRITDALKILQIKEKLTNAELNEKRKLIFRKLARKTAVHLY